jgi:hypothetical protein
MMTSTGCSLDFRHLSITEEENDNANILTWDDSEADIASETWDTVGIATWEDVDAICNPIYSAILFDDISDGYPMIDTAVLDFQSNGQYFEGEKVYELVGNKFDLNKLIGDVATGSAIIIVCVVIEGATAGTGSPIAIFFAGTAETAGATASAIELAKVGSVLGGAMGAVTNYIDSDADWEQTLFGTLEGAADGYKWGALFGAIQGGTDVYKQYFPKNTTKYFAEGTEQAEKYPKGVIFDKHGYPRFEPYKIAEAKFDLPTKKGVAEGTCLSGNYARDAKLANKQCGYDETPEGYVWHHVEDMMTMILVPQDLHSPAFHGFWHKGGASLIKELLDGAIG